MMEVEPMRLEPVQRLYERGRPPFSTVWLETSQDSHDADRQLELRWRSARDRLAEQGADEATLAALDGAVGPTNIGGQQSQLLVAAGGEVLLVDHLPVRPAPEVVAVGTLPQLLPWLVVPRRPPYLLVLMDRTGADITLHAPNSVETVVVQSDRYPVERNAPGGWSQRRYQQAALENWHRNAADVAEEVDRLRRTHNIGTVLVGGDDPACAALLDQLPVGTRRLVQHLPEVSRAPGASAEALVRKVAEALARVVAQDLEQLVAEFEQERGQHDRAAEGFAAVCAAARLGQVSTMLANGPVLDNLDTVWIGPRPEQVGESREEVAALGAAEPVPARADAALVRAVVAEDGAVVGMDPERLAVKDGVGAVLRYAVRPG
jgi:hypothetical protein